MHCGCAVRCALLRTRGSVRASALRCSPSIPAGTTEGREGLRTAPTADRDCTYHPTRHSTLHVDGITCCIKSRDHLPLYLQPLCLFTSDISPSPLLIRHLNICLRCLCRQLPSLPRCPPSALSLRSASTSSTACACWMRSTRSTARPSQRPPPPSSTAWQPSAAMWRDSSSRTTSRQISWRQRSSESDSPATAPTPSPSSPVPFSSLLHSHLPLTPPSPLLLCVVW